MADCRNCRYFIPLPMLRRLAGARPEEYGEALEIVEILGSHGQSILGWCMKRKAPVKYYVGTCRFYRPIGINNRKLTEFLKV